VINSTLDPLSQVHAALWEMLEADPEWCDMVPPGNRIKFSGKSVSPRKDQQASPADRPEVQIRATAVIPKLYANSSSTEVTARFEIQIATGEQGLDCSLFPVLWETIRAMHNAWGYLRQLTWGGMSKTFVHRVQATPGAIGVSQGDADRGMLWWSVLWGCEIDIGIPASLMIRSVE